MWIIRVEGFSSKRDWSRILKEIKKSPLNILVVKSDRNQTFDFRHQSAISDINKDTLVYGNMTMLEDFHKAAQNRTLLETALGPTEAVKKTYVADLQNSTERNLMHTNIKKNEDAWYYQCLSKYIVWQYFDPRGAKLDAGFAHVVHTNVNDNCLNHPATTRVSLPGAAQVSLVSNLPDVKQCPLTVDGKSRHDIQWGCFSHVTGKSQAARGIFPKSIKTPIVQGLDDETFRKQVNQQSNVKRQLIEFAIPPLSLKALVEKIRKSAAQ